MNPDELAELQKRLAEFAAQADNDAPEGGEDEEHDDETPPDTARGGKRYQRLIESERPTVPPPKQSEVRAVPGADDTADLPAIPGAPRLPKTSTSSS